MSRLPRFCVSYKFTNVQYACDKIDALLAGLNERTLSRSPSPILPPFKARALQYYQVKVASILGGAVDLNLWTKSILQLRETEPAIRPSLVVVSNSWEV